MRRATLKTPVSQGLHTACAERMCDDCLRDLAALETALREAEAEVERLQGVHDTCHEIQQRERGRAEALEAALKRIAFTDAPRYWAQDEARRALAGEPEVCPNCGVSATEFPIHVESVRQAVANGWKNLSCSSPEELRRYAALAGEPRPLIRDTRHELQTWPPVAEPEREYPYGKHPADDHNFESEQEGDPTDEDVRAAMARIDAARPFGPKQEGAERQ